MIRFAILLGYFVFGAFTHHANADSYVVRSEVRRGSVVLSQSEQSASPWKTSSLGMKSGSGEFRHTDIRVDPIGGDRVRVDYQLALNEDLLDLTFTCELGEEISLAIGSLKVDLIIEDCAATESLLCEAKPELEPENNEADRSFISFGETKEYRNLIRTDLE